MKKTVLFVLALAMAGALVSAQGIGPVPSFEKLTAPVFGYEIVKTYPHDAQAVTQGLIYIDGFLYESTGARGKGTLVKVELETGKVVKQHDIDPMFTTEGMALYGGRFYQITLRSGLGFIYDRETFAELGRFNYGGTGSTWAIEHDGKRLIISGPTSTLRFFDPATMMETGSVVVRDGDQEINRIDELEVINGELWANIYQTDKIAVINTDTGRVTKWIDLAGIAAPDGRLMKPPQPGAIADAVLNGIAYDKSGDRLFVTGKYWPQIFEIKLKPRTAASAQR